jgi:hypothetical protein
MEDLLSRVRLLPRDTKSRKRPVLPAIVAVACYCVLAVLAYWPASPLDSSVIPGATTGDPVQSIWYLEWVPFALFHGHNPFFTNFIDYPSGVNLASNTLASALGLGASPMTLILGPVATYNFLLRLALASSATSMCFVLRSWTRWWPAAFAGGLLYGFSSYMSEQGPWHLSLAFMPIPPLIFWCLNELFVRQRRSPRWTGILLGLLCAVQFLIHAEVLADCVLIGTVGVLALAITRRREAMDRARRILPALGWAAACFTLVCAYPIWLLVAGPQHLTGPVAPIWFISQDHLDLLSPIRRNIVVHIVYANGSPYLSHGIQLITVNNSGYLGFPLAALIAICAISQRRLRIVRLAMLLGLVSFVLSLGPRLTLNGTSTGIPLPAILLTHVPLLDDMVWNRWALFETLFACVVLSVGLDRWFGYLRRMASSEHVRNRLSSASPPFSAERFPRFIAAAMPCAIAAAVLIPLASAYPLTGVRMPWPSRLASSLRQSVPKGGVVLALPYVTSATNAPMAWQAIDGMQFRIVGGYATVPGPTGSGTWHVNPTKALTLFDLAVIGAGTGTLATNLASASTFAVRACEAVPEVLRGFSVNAVVVWPTGIYQSLVSDFLRPVLGAPSRHFGQALVWYDVQRALARHPQCGSGALIRAMRAARNWLPSWPHCWAITPGSGMAVKTRTVSGKGPAQLFSAAGARRYYTLADIPLATPVDWMHKKYIRITYKGTGSGKAYGLYFELAPNEIAKYTIVDNSDGWRTVSLPTAQRGIPATAWSHLIKVGLALSPKSATGTIAIDCPAASNSR